MVFAEGAGLVLSDLLVQGDGFIVALSRRVCACKAVAYGERAGVVGTQDTGQDCDDLLVQGDGFIAAAS